MIATAATALDHRARLATRIAVTAAALLLALVATLFAATARAEVGTPFTPAAFEAAQKAGKPILIDVNAPWCPVCKAQAPTLAALPAVPEFKGLTVFSVDFDTQKDVLRSLGVQKQSTLIVFAGAKETGRTVGDTDPASIRKLVATAFAG
ncbi:thioredoxin family protein [Pseudoxanthobacter sp. M-2]|uniref:thioredoxin family protein n=1 Tax=Pseudoxanthobacter sp. M-2 TaxID=3078754 RepID=UPI0038FD026F